MEWNPPKMPTLDERMREIGINFRLAKLPNGEYQLEALIPDLMATTKSWWPLPTVNLADRAKRKPTVVVDDCCYGLDGCGCGGRPVALRESVGDDFPVWVVVCPGCGRHTLKWKKPAKAAAEWNAIVDSGPASR